MAAGSTVAQHAPLVQTKLNAPQFARVDQTSFDVPVAVFPPGKDTEYRINTTLGNLFASATGLTVVLSFGSDGTGDIAWDACVQRKKAGDVTDDTFATTNVQTGTVTVSTAGVNTKSIAIANAKLAPTVAAGDPVTIRLRRLGSTTTDTATTSNVTLRHVELRDT